jgi:hypothetical protein
MSNGGISPTRGLSRIWQEGSVPCNQPHQRAQAGFGAFLAQFRRLRRRLSGSCTVAPPLKREGRQKDLQQSYLHKLSQPTFDIRATTIELTRLADRLTDKKANIHNLSKAQHKLTEDQLRQLAENFKSFRTLRHSLDIAIDRVLADGVTNEAEKRFLTLLRTIATNIDATGEMIESLSAKKGFDADLTAGPSQDGNRRSLEHAFQVAWDQVKHGSKESAGALIQAAIVQPLSTRRISREVSIQAQWDSVRQQWQMFKKRGTFDSSESQTLLEAALRRQGDKERSLCRETAATVVSTVSKLATASE